MIKINNKVLNTYFQIVSFGLTNLNFLFLYLKINVYSSLHTAYSNNELHLPYIVIS